MATFQDKITTFAALSQVPSDTLNKIQQRSIATPSWPTVGSPQLDAFPVDLVNASGPEQYIRYGITASTLAFQNDVLVLDDSIDWMDRLIVFTYQFFPVGITPDGADGLPGGARDDLFNQQATVSKNALIDGKLCYTAAGAVTAGAVNPTAGNPPVIAGAAGCFAQYLDSSNDLILYVERLTPFRLCIYNESGDDYFLGFKVWASGKIGYW